MLNGIAEPGDIEAILRDQLNLEPADYGNDLLESGLLDSLALVQLIMHIENHYDVVLPIDDLEFENFRSVETICSLVNRLRAGA